MRQTGIQHSDDIMGYPNSFFKNLLNKGVQFIFNESSNFIVTVNESVFHMKGVRFTYNEDNNVIMTVNESASQRRGSEYFS